MRAWVVPSSATRPRSRRDSRAALALTGWHQHRALQLQAEAAGGPEWPPDCAGDSDGEFRRLGRPSRLPVPLPVCCHWHCARSPTRKPSQGAVHGHYYSMVRRLGSGCQSRCLWLDNDESPATCSIPGPGACGCAHISFRMSSFLGGVFTPDSDSRIAQTNGNLVRARQRVRLGCAAH